MTFSQLLANRRFKALFITLIVGSVIYLVVNVFVIGGDEFYRIFNNTTTPALAAITTLQLYLVWRLLEREKAVQENWTYLLVGMGLWAIADTIWSYYALILNVDVPYPSIADAVWMAGYFLLFVGLYAQYTSFNTRPTERDRLIVWVLIGVSTLLTGYFVLLPILRDFDASRLIESMLNVLYPLVDLILLIISFLIISTLGEGKLAIPWKIIIAGIVIRAVSDLIFSYITWQEIYSPGEHVNLITALYDFIYTFSYPIIGLGFVAYGMLITETSNVDIPAAQDVIDQPETAKNFILVSTDGDHKVIFYSNNFLQLLKKQDEQNIKGASLYELLGMDEAQIKAFETELQQLGFVAGLAFKFKNAAGSEIDIRLSALAVYYESDTVFKGANLIISTLSPLGVPDNLSAESQAMVKSILSKTGNLQKETRATLSSYFNAQMRMLENLVNRYGGKTIAQTMRMVINETATKRNWQVRKQGMDYVIFDQSDISAQAKVMSVLLDTARTYAINMVGSQLVKVEIENINAQINTDMMKSVENYNMRLNG